MGFVRRFSMGVQPLRGPEMTFLMPFGPGQCPGACAAALLPLRTACADFLKSDGAVYFKSLIDSAAEQCAATPAPQAGGAQLCQPGGRLAADGGSHGRQHRSTGPVYVSLVILNAEQTGGHENDFSEKDAKLAQRLGQLQPFMAVFPQECMGQLAYFGPT
jgi:hypothetical protein